MKGYIRTKNEVNATSRSEIFTVFICEMAGQNGGYLVFCKNLVKKIKIKFIRDKTFVTKMR